jgi:hypothetical protein
MKQGPRSFRPEGHRRQTQVRLIGAGFAILVVVGGGLIWLFYGRTEALVAVACLLVMAGVLGLLWLILTLLEWFVKEDEP